MDNILKDRKWLTDESFLNQLSVYSQSTILLELREINTGM